MRRAGRRPGLQGARRPHPAAAVDRLFERDGRTLTELEAEVPDLTRFGVMRHLAVLEEAGLVVTRRRGRYKHHYLNPVPIACSPNGGSASTGTARGGPARVQGHLEGTT